MFALLHNVVKLSHKDKLWRSQVQGENQDIFLPRISHQLTL